MEKRILIVGHGASGILAAKKALELGFIPVITCIDKLEEEHRKLGDTLNDIAISINKLKKPDLKKPVSKFHK